MKANEWNYDLFKKKFPTLFSEGCYFECLQGWKEIIYNLCESLEPIVKEINDEYRGFPYITQVKEKYGKLRIYMSSANDEIEELIEDAERLSSVTCEVCGCPGKIRGTTWMITRCESCL